MLKRFQKQVDTRTKTGPSERLAIVAFTVTTEFERELIDLCSDNPRLALSVVSRIDVNPSDVPLVSQPAFVVVELDGSPNADLEIIREVNQAPWRAGARLVATAANFDDTAILRIIRSGADDFLVQPATRDEFERITNRGGGTGDWRARGSVGATLAFIHCSGGAGATTLAVNSAMALQRAGESLDLSTCVLDLDVQFGGVGVQLDMETSSPISDILSAPDRLDRAMLEAMMQTHSSGIRVLTAPDLPLPYDALNRQIVGRIIKLARRRFDYVVIDMPAALVDWTDEALRRSNRIFLVVQATVPCIRQARRLLRALAAESLGDVPISIVVNRYDGTWQGTEGITIQQIEGALGRDVDFTVSSDFDLMSASGNQGVPVASLKPRSRIARQLDDMIRPHLPKELQSSSSSTVQRLLHSF